MKIFQNKNLSYESVIIEISRSTVLITVQTHSLARLSYSNLYAELLASMGLYG